MVKVPFIRLVTVLCGNGGQRGIKTSSYFQKKFFYKFNKKLNSVKKNKFLKNYAGIGPRHIQTSQTIGSTGAGRMWRSKALYFQRETRHHSECSNGCSRGLLFVGFSMTAKCKSPTCWDSSGQKKTLVLWPWSAYLCNFSWKAVKKQMLEGLRWMAQHLATVWHWSPVSVRWP